MGRDATRRQSRGATFVVQHHNVTFPPPTTNFSENAATVHHPCTAPAARSASSLKFIPQWWPCSAENSTRSHPGSRRANAASAVAVNPVPKPSCSRPLPPALHSPHTSPTPLPSPPWPIPWPPWLMSWSPITPACTAEKVVEAVNSSSSASSSERAATSSPSASSCVTGVRCGATCPCQTPFAPPAPAPPAKTPFAPSCQLTPASASASVATQNKGCVDGQEGCVDGQATAAAGTLKKLSSSSSSESSSEVAYTREGGPEPK
mmetsp:Transcript_8060/g.20000  ORF Transcript_8060/g.20000 Transcript_8060/m.20000 type:complete len:262 (-) Transcript_8060:106-891(-)